MNLGIVLTVYAMGCDGIILFIWKEPAGGEDD